MSKSVTSYSPVVCFLAVVSVFAHVSYWISFSSSVAAQSIGLMILQFSPAAAALITQLYFRKSIRGFGWGWGKSRYQLVSYLLPFLLSLVGFGLVWMLGFGSFDSVSFVDIAQEELATTFGINQTSPYKVLLLVIILNGTFGLLISIGSLGEEIGWRGFLVPELMKHHSYTTTSMITGLAWAIFHFPLLVYLVAPRLDASVLPLMVFVTISAIGLSLVLAWLRLRSGSVWSAVLFHAALNIHLQGFFQPLTSETSELTKYISGEQGLMMALVAAVAGFLFWRKRGVVEQQRSTELL